MKAFCIIIFLKKHWSFMSLFFYEYQALHFRDIYQMRFL